MNELMTVIAIVVNYAGILLAYKLFKKEGVFCWIAFAYVLANIETLKSIDLFGVPVTLGNVLFCTMVLATDILNENHGKKDAKKGLWIGFYVSIAFTILTQIDLLFVPNASDFVNDSFKTIFSFAPRVCLASLISYVISNQVDIHLFQLLKKKFPSDKQYFIRKNGSNIVSQFVDSVTFTCLAFIGVFPANTIISLCLTTYLVKIIIATTDTPFMHIAKKIEKKRVKE